MKYQHKGNFEKAIEELKQSGELAQISQKYFGADLTK